MIPRAIWTSLKKDDGDQDEGPRKPLPLPQGRIQKEEKRTSSKPAKESISREEAKTDLVRLSRMEDREEASKLGMSVEDWLAEKKERSVQEWLSKSVEPGEGTKKRWVHSLEVNEHPERKPKSSDELIEDVLAALKNGEQFLKNARSSTEGEVVDLSSGDESEGENRKKKKKKHKEKDKVRDKERERVRKKKKKRESESDDSTDERRDRERKKKKRREGSEEEERLRQIALNSLGPEHSRERKSSAQAEDGRERRDNDKDEDVEAEVDHLAAEVNSLTADTNIPKSEELSHEEEVKKRSDQLLDDLFIYMCREKKKKDEEEAKKTEKADQSDEEPNQVKKEHEEDFKKEDRYRAADGNRVSEERNVKDQSEKDKDRSVRRRKENDSNRDCERRSSDRNHRRANSKDRKSTDNDRKYVEKDRRSSDRDRKVYDKAKKRSRSRDRRRSRSRSRKVSPGRGKKSSDARTSRGRSRSAGRRSDGKTRRSRSKKRSSRSRSKKRSSRSKSKKRSSRSGSRKRTSRSPKRSNSREGGDRPRSRSQELLDAANRFDRSKKTKTRMKQHLLEQMKLMKIAKEQMKGGKDSLRALSMQCMEIARKGLEEEAKAPQEEEAEASSEEEVENHDVILYVYATPSMMRITKSNANYKNILNQELEKYGKLGTCTGFWMTPHGYDLAYEKTIGDGMGGKAKAAYRPTGTSLLAIGYEGLVDYKKVYLPTTIKISTPSPEKWDKKGLIKTIFARASLYGDINIQDTNPHGKMHPPSAFPTATGTAPAMTESSTDLVLFNPNQEQKGPYNPFSKEAKEWEKEKRRQALLEALLPGGNCHPDSVRPAIENHHVPFNPFSKEAKEAERLKKEQEKEAKEKKEKKKKKKVKEEEKSAVEADPKGKNPFKKPPQFNPFLEGFRPSSYGYGEVRWTDEGPLDATKLGNRFKPEHTTKYKL